MSTERHLTEADLSAASESERPESAATTRHLNRCETCRVRLAEAIAIRAAVARAAEMEVEPEHDLAKRAVAAIRRREQAVASLNGTVGTFAGVARAAMDFAFGRRT